MKEHVYVVVSVGTIPTLVKVFKYRKDAENYMQHKKEKVPFMSLSVSEEIVRGE